MNGILLAIFATAALAVVIFLVLLYLEFSSVPRDEREFMDPLPGLLQRIWPLVNWATARTAHFFPAAYRANLQRRLLLSGMHYLLTVDQFLGVKVIGGLLAALAMALALGMLGALDPLYLVLAGALGFFLPDLRLNDARKLRSKRIVRELPDFLDFLVLGIEAGQNLSGAIRLTLAKGPPGVLRQEFTRVLRDISAGVTRADALQQMQDRVGVREITNMVSAMVQAERVGSSLAPVLREQAAQRRAERFLAAEKKAFEAPVLMLGPLVIFIFPGTFAFLGYFLYQKIAMSGGF
ncbi:type II secretion system F family protein [Xenophilus sp. Marseille-Q4582]|uniref:type II secretion system F family protein n=1 Tax=Xenophilus sp. Marseille-Q4582 TaxID=2866600 RepID=UPI001CE4B35C|nr:type II secretion system F family protein [Xenophilus sp. Marseille-Q4582]